MNHVDLLKDGDFEIIPAYNRDYISSNAARKDWFEGKDFRIRANPSTYINIRDAEKYCNQGAYITIRYKKGLEVVPVRVGETKEAFEIIRSIEEKVGCYCPKCLHKFNREDMNGARCLECKTMIESIDLDEMEVFHERIEINGKSESISVRAPNKEVFQKVMEVMNITPYFV